MQNSYLTLLALAAAATASITPGTKPFADPWVWSITDFQGGCSPAACTFGFNITAPDYLRFGGFEAECGGSTLDNNGGLVDCDVPGDDGEKGAVSARIGEFVERDGHQYVYTYVNYVTLQPVLQYVSVSYNFSGTGEGLYEYRIDPTPYNFNITPTAVDIQKVLV